MKLTITSKIKPEQLMSKILEQADPARFLSSFTGSKPFQINHKGLKFRLNKRIYYRNSFIPFFYGEVRPTPDGSEIIGEFHMHWAVRIFMTIWFGGVGLGATATLFQVIQHGLPKQKPEMLLIPFGMLFFGYLLIQFGKVLSRKHQSDILLNFRSCAGLEVVKTTDFLVKPILKLSLWPYELLLRRGLAFLWDSIIPGLPEFFLDPKHFSGFWGWLFLPTFFLYETICLAIWGRGLGKKMAQLKVKTAEGEKPSLGMILIRTGIKTAFLAPFYFDPKGTWLVGLTVALFLIPWLLDKDHRFLHDRFAKTLVVLEG